LRGIDRRLRKLKEKGEVSENSYFQESDFENIFFSATEDPVNERELAELRFSISWAGI
jgi:hypothetical protein